MESSTGSSKHYPTPEGLSIIQSDTLSTQSPLVTLQSNSSDSFTDSCFGSVGEGHQSVLIQKIPSHDFTSASQLPKPHLQLANQQLLAATIQNQPQICVELLTRSHDQCAYVNIKDEYGMSPLHIASQNGYLKVCEVLLDYGRNTDINIRNSLLETPLHLACKTNKAPIAQLLVRSGAQLNPLDVNNNSPLHFIVSQNNIKLLNWFLTKRPDITQENIDGNTPADLSPSREIRDILREYYENLNSDTPFFGSHNRHPQEPHQVQVKMVNPAQQGSLSPLDFQALLQLGKGSFGEVYLVRKLDSLQLFAMKVLKKETIKRQNLIKYAMTQRNVLCYIRHPFIVSLNYAFQTSESLILILDYCPGKSLAHYLAKQRRFDQARARLYLCEILLALEELHRRDIIFRDLKPDNIVLNPEGHALLTDFGLSRQGVSDHLSAQSFCGSLAYLAPQMIKRRGHGKAVDWYLLGVLLYQMLVGIPPYFSSKKEELLLNIQKGKLRVPSSLSVECKSLLKGLLQREPSQRLGSKKDAQEIKQHPFFRGINWKSVLKMQLAVPQPEITVIPNSRIPPESIFGDTFDQSDNRVDGWTFISN